MYKNKLENLIQTLQRVAQCIFLMRKNRNRISKIKINSQQKVNLDSVKWKCNKSYSVFVV